MKRDPRERRVVARAGLDRAGAQLSEPDYCRLIIGVLRGQRGGGYVNDLLSEMMRPFTEISLPGEKVGADTDFGTLGHCPGIARRLAFGPSQRAS